MFGKKVRYAGGIWSVSKENADGSLVIEQHRVYSDGDSICEVTVERDDVVVVEQPDMRAHRLADVIADRVRRQEALGTPSIYNIAREVLIEEFAADDPSTRIANAEAEIRTAMGLS